ncbi:MAG: hypothetical protein ACM31N_05755 [Deltaproteobacteria bacterium]
MSLHALAAFLVLCAAIAGPAKAGEHSPPVVPAGSLSPDNTAAGAMVVDRTHAYLEQSILNRVIWFDDFFGNVKSEDARRPEYLLRWRNTVRWDEGGKFKFLTSARASLRLPKLNERIRLVVSGETEAEPAPGLPEDPGNPGFDRTLQNTRLVNTELRYGILKSPDMDLFLGAGVRLVLPVEPFVRSRFLYTRRLDNFSLVRVGETVFWKKTLGLGETTEVDLERQLGTKTLLRLANSGTLAQESRGLEWGTELSVLRQLSPLSAISLAGGVFGSTRPVAVVDSYRIYTRYRRNFLRSWLFFELEPEISWPRNAGGAYTSAMAFTFRVEVVFQGKSSGD